MVRDGPSDLLTTMGGLKGLRRKMRASRSKAEIVCNTVADRCFASLQEVGPLLLAVSGGPDSMALMHLAARWAAGLIDPPRLHIATVDHGFRPEAASEAGMVATAAAALGQPHAILPWTGPKPTSRIQEKARAARYALLAAHARDIGAGHIVTAHHADDQAETILLRLGRGSGLGGLAGMRHLTALAPDLWLARPLLHLTKATLVAFCRENAIAYIDDPTNLDPAYARTRLRSQAPALAALGLDTPGLSRLARRLARADDALEFEADRVESFLQPTRAPGSYAVALDGVCNIAPEIALRLVRRAVAHVVPGAALRLERLESLSDALWTALTERRPHRATLAGTLVRLDGAGLLQVTHEPPRRRGTRRRTHPPGPH